MPPDDWHVETGDARVRPSPDRESAVKSRSQRTSSGDAGDISLARREGRKTLAYVAATAVVSNCAGNAAWEFLEWVKTSVGWVWSHVHLTIHVWWN